MGGPEVSDLFAHQVSRASLEAKVEEFGPLVASGSGDMAILRLHESPLVEVRLKAEVVLLGTFDVSDARSVVMARWEVERAKNEVVTRGVVAEIDEFVLPRDELRLESLLTRLAIQANFTPVKPRLRGIGLVTNRAVELLDDPETWVAATAAIHDVGIEFIPRGDPSNQRYIDEVERLLAMNRHSVLIVVHDHERWIWNRTSSYQKRPRRVAVSVAASTGPTWIRVISAAMGEIANASPEIPIVRWGDDALSRVTARTGGSFHISDRAKGHLLRNPYPRVERMLEHLERLADLADALVSGDLDGDRFVKKARLDFALEISLFDSNISEQAAAFRHDGALLDNRPHVKVDDYTNPGDCGRIYFGIDRASGRIVVDFVGIHDRY
jgi:hypothetical protein